MEAVVGLESGFSSPPAKTPNWLGLECGPLTRKIVPQQVNPGPVRAILYERVSSAEQKRKGFSLHAQHHDLKDYCARQGYRIVRAYRETGKRRDMSREALVRLLELAEKGVYDVVVVWRRDRFGAGRDVVDIEDFLRKRGVRVEAMMMGPQPNTSIVRFTNRMLDLVADLEVDTTSERCHGGRLQAAREGKWPTAPPPGYTRNYPGKDIIIDESVAHQIRGIFESVVAGRSVRDAVTRYGDVNHVSAINRLHNPAYKGQASYCGIPVPFPAIVSETTWELAQRALAERKRSTGKRGAGPLPSEPTPPVPNWPE